MLIKVIIWRHVFLRIYWSFVWLILLQFLNKYIAFSFLLLLIPNGALFSFLFFFCFKTCIQSRKIYLCIITYLEKIFSVMPVASIESIIEFELIEIINIWIKVSVVYEGNKAIGVVCQCRCRYDYFSGYSFFFFCFSSSSSSFFRYMHNFVHNCVYENNTILL